VRRASVLAPAKLNLGLRVVGRRADGYHELESLFVPLELHDALSVACGGSGIRLSVDGDEARDVPADGRNLAWRAAERFLARARVGEGLSLSITKRTPSPAGLGGGSSDAGAVLAALARLFPGRVAPTELARIALELGADVPYFLDPSPALVEGIGERIAPLCGVPALELLLAHPGVGLATRDVYSALDVASLTQPRALPTIRALLALREEPGTAPVRWPSDESLRALVWNDLEAAATRLLPRVAELREELTATGARAVGMSGSGPTLYAIYPDRASAAAARERVGQRGVRTWLTRSHASRQAPPAAPPAGLR
jgi:4-diphosphocytidyl-2-C-methyl-D-erythritol kinase